MIDDALNLTVPDESAMFDLVVPIPGGPGGPGGPRGPAGPRGPGGPAGPRLIDDKRLRSTHSINNLTCNFHSSM